MFQVVCVFLLQTTISAGQTGSAVPSVVRRIGVGYNLLYGNPDGTHWKSGGEDPGLLVTRHILDLGKSPFFEQLLLTVNSRHVFQLFTENVEVLLYPLMSLSSSDI